METGRSIGFLIARRSVCSIGLGIAVWAKRADKRVVFDNGITTGE